MTYVIDNSYKEKMAHQKDMTDNSVTYIKVDYVTEGIDVTVHNVDGGGGVIWVF